jgi:hypothetical protein
MAAAAALVVIQVARASIRLAFPEQVPGPPIYAQISNLPAFGEEIYHSDEWAAIPFYRETGCVPGAFNLLDMYDIPTETSAGAFGCPLTIKGFEIWPAPPDQAPGPLHMQGLGLGKVPIYFVSWPELRAAVSDRILTFAELSSLPSLKIGYASFFSVNLHPSGLAKVPHIEISARGTLQDGRQFQFHVAGGDQSTLVKHVKIVGLD